MKLGGATVGRLVFEPGWQWSKHIKPIARTEWCMAPHTIYMLAGHLRTRMNDGQEFELGPGDVAFIPPGHDGWVVGDETCVGLDFTGMADYAKVQASARQAAGEPAAPPA